MKYPSMRRVSNNPIIGHHSLSYPATSIPMSHLRFWSCFHTQRWIRRYQGVLRFFFGVILHFGLGHGIISPVDCFVVRHLPSPIQEYGIKLIAQCEPFDRMMTGESYKWVWMSWLLGRSDKNDRFSPCPCDQSSSQELKRYETLFLFLFSIFV